MALDEATKLRVARVAVFALFAASTVALVMRSYYSFCWIDESFYLSLADRLYRGGALFVDEWHPAQFYAPLLLAPYALFMAINGSPTGVIFFFRIVYVVLSLAIAVFAYLSFKDYFGRFLACCMSLTYLFYMRANILGLSYYALCTSFFLLGLVFAWLTYQRIMNEVDIGAPSTQRVVYPMAAGASFGLATICNPMVVFFLFFACLTGLIRAVILRRARSFLPFMWGMAGCVIVACLYLIFVFQHAEPAAIIANLPHILSSHDENLTYAQRLPNFLSYLPVSRVGFVGTWALVIFLIFWRITGRGVSRRFRTAILLLDTLCLLLACWIAITTTTYPHKVFLAFAEFALPCYLLQEDLSFSIEQHPELHLFWIPGILLALIWQFSSNTQISGMLIGFMFTCLGAFVTVRNAVPSPAEMLRDSLSQPAPQWLRATGMVLIACLVVCTAAIRLGSVYSDCEWGEMTATIEDGPAQGLRTSPQHLADYEGVRDLMAHVDTDGGIWIEPMSPWAYLEAPGPCAAVSTWNTFMDEADAQVYYAEDGHEAPQWILVTKDDAGYPVNVVAGRTRIFPALDMYYTYNAQLRAWLDGSPDYGPVYQTEYGTLYKRAEHSFIGAPD